MKSKLKGCILVDHVNAGKDKACCWDDKKYGETKKYFVYIEI